MDKKIYKLIKIKGLVAVALILLCAKNGHAITFNEAIEKLAQHESVDAIYQKSKAISEQADLKGSWGDPNIKIVAKNYPIDSLKNDQSPMTGIEFGISQKIPLTTKYENIADSFKSLAKAYKYNAQDRKASLAKSFWEMLIIKRKIKGEIGILVENKRWINKTLKVSKRLYANGKTSQQTIFDIQIRKYEVESEISNKSYELLQISDKIKYVTGNDMIDENTIPWELLNKNHANKIDYRELALKEKARAKDFGLTASKLNYVPDLTLSLGATIRSDIDGNEDFVGASVSFPLPFSGEKYSNHGAAVAERYAAIKEYENYRKEKQRDTSVVKNEIYKNKNELKILNEKTVKFAQDSRSIAAKLYGLGNSSYIELLQSELKLKKILMHKIMLQAKIDIQKITLKYLSGEPLHE